MINSSYYHISLYFPLKILLVFLVFTEILFFVGPLEYGTNNHVSLLLYLFIVNYALYKGYVNGIRRFRPTYCIFKVSNAFVSFIIFSGFLINIMIASDQLKSHGLSLSFSSIAYSLLNAGDAYSSSSNYIVDYPTIITIFLFVGWSSIPIGIYFWKRMSRILKVILILSVLVVIIGWLGIGTRKGILDMIVVCSFMTFASNYAGVIKNKKKFLFLVLLLFLLFIFYFVLSNLSRYGFSDFRGLEEIGSTSLYRDFYIQNLPLSVTVFFAQIASYTSQGYNALSRALDMGILDLAPLGSNWWTIHMSKLWFGYDPTPMTYMWILQGQGIDMSINWHTIYVWLANDFTFVGVPFIIYFIGYFFAQSWADSVYGKNPFAYPVAAYFIIMVLYFFANNQVLSDSFLSFFMCLFIYYFTRKKVRYENNIIGSSNVSR